MQIGPFQPREDRETIWRLYRSKQLIYQQTFNIAYYYRNVYPLFSQNVSLSKTSATNFIIGQRVWLQFRERKKQQTSWKQSILSVRMT